MSESVDRADAVLDEKRGAVGWVTLNRPDQLNAYKLAMRDALFGASSAIHDVAEVRAMVLTDAGPLDCYPILRRS